MATFMQASGNCLRPDSKDGNDFKRKTETLIMADGRKAGG
jgi:hypothetical protein